MILCESEENTRTIDDCESGEPCVLATFRNNMHGGFCSVNKNWRAKQGEEGNGLRISEIIAVNVLK